MKPPPPKPKGTPDDLHEVERALSVLQGRHPEHERARREDEEARQRRVAALDKEARAASTKSRLRRLLMLAIAVPVVLAAVGIFLFARSVTERSDRLDAVATPFRAYGFAVLETSSRGTPGALEATIEPGCLVAISSGQAPIAVTRAGKTTEGPGPTLFCTCTSERIGIASKLEEGGGLVLLRADAPVIGGTRAFAFAPFKPGTTLHADDPCADATFDAWLEAKHYPHPAVDDAWLTASPARAPLTKAGFHVAAKLGGALPFVVVEMPKDSCLLATSTTPADRLNIRVKGGATPPADAAGTIGRCAQAESTVVVSREGSGEVVVIVAPAAALGGVQGFRELASNSGLALATISVPSADRAWDAKQLLLASTVPDSTITTASTPDVPLDDDARVVGLSFETPSALTPDPATGVFSYCSPPLDDKVHEAICVFSGPNRWRTAGADAVGGLARSKLPFWLFTMQGVSDPVALKSISELLTLARKLAHDGFVPTTLEAITELPTGVEILGRTGEDAVVAVGTGPAEPWVYPLTDGPAWTLDGTPRIVPCTPLTTLTLNAMIKTLPPKASRRTVVFRRQKP